MRAGTAAAAVALSGVLLYRWLLRDRVLNWSAQEAEVAARLPGDELLDVADAVATRAITIDAPPSAVWPWIAQMGPAPRGGAYTFDWIENLFGLRMHTVPTACCPSSSTRLPAAVLCERDTSWVRTFAWPRWPEAPFAR